jgi:hypothetical protein
MALSGAVVRASDRDPPIHARIRAAATQNLLDNTVTAILFDTDDIDDDSGHSTVTNTSRYTFQRDGRFEIAAVVYHGASTAGTSRQVDLAINGVAVNGAIVSSGPRPGGTGVMQQNLAGQIVTVVATDYAEIRGSQNSGGTLATQAGSNMTVKFLGEV